MKKVCIMKKFLVILCFLLLPLISFANDFEAVEDDLNGIEEWHFTFGLGINTSATYGGYEGWESRNFQKQMTRITYLEFMYHSTLSQNMQIGFGIDSVSTVVNAYDEDAGTYEDDVIVHAMTQMRLSFFFDRIGSGFYMDGGIGYVLFQGLGLQGGMGFAIELSPKESSLLLGFKYTYVKGTYRPFQLFSEEQEEHPFSANILSLHATLLW